ncbi:trans-aconitate 2-methyltransferase [Aerosakkonemataceae cyanobacterium BLCC-F50]|uniref:Trans-aconitate 2-methyltransferase n=1 Tax=Floridaenema flaviceps BLCC-F50 TaxID=3153642 RepID=A0ABV4XVA4_9CYAN
MNDWYKEDLAYIHDVGFRSYVLQAMPGILAILNQHDIQDGLIIDLGCGSGLAAEELVRVGYQVLGVDISAAMIEIARQRVPMAQFQLDSLFQVDIPNCHAVIALGECFNYLFDPEPQTLTQVFQRIYNALTPGGVFIFDIAEPGQVTNTTPIKSFTQGDDWIVLVEKQENSVQHILTRRIITFRQVGDYYRRDEEVHYLRLYSTEEITTILHQLGFQVEAGNCYGQFALPHAHVAFIAKKPIMFLKEQV